MAKGCSHKSALSRDNYHNSAFSWLVISHHSASCRSLASVAMLRTGPLDMYNLLDREPNSSRGDPCNPSRFPTYSSDTNTPHPSTLSSFLPHHLPLARSPWHRPTHASASSSCCSQSARRRARTSRGFFPIRGLLVGLRISTTFLLPPLRPPSSGRATALSSAATSSMTSGRRIERATASWATPTENVIRSRLTETPRSWPFAGASRTLA